jgi:hypothetical protein
MQDLQPMIANLRAAGRVDPEAAARLDDQAREEWAYAAGLQIWIYGLPLMRTEQLRRWMVELDKPVEDLPYAPINQLGHMRHLPDSSSHLPFTPNVDTLYSGSIIELMDNPMVFIAPAMPDRYWSLQVADAWYSNQPYLGTRVTGSDAGGWLLVAPDWHGEVPTGLTLYRSESNTITIALRIRIEGEHDTMRGVDAQNGFRLMPLDRYLDGSFKPSKPGQPPRVPLDTHNLAFFTTLCRLLAHNPPYERDASIVALMDVLGFTPGADIDPDSIDPVVRRGLVRADDQGPKVIGWKVKYRGRKSPTMWNVDLRGGTYGTDYLARAEGAIQGLFVHDAEECTYFHTYHDGNGAPLDGGRDYSLRLAPDQLATVDKFGFWSITAYNPSFLLIDNDLRRYSIQSSDPQLARDSDGGITIRTGPQPPKNLSNWVATTPGDIFRLNYRVYLPTPEMIASAEAVNRYLPPVMPV